MKRDLLAALIAILIIAALCYGLAFMRPALAPTSSHPFTLATGPAPTAHGEENVVIRVNGEPITEREFAIFASSLPQQAQMFLSNPAGRRVIAEQYVRMKVLEQEGRRLGADVDPDVEAKMRFGKTNVAVEYAIQKIAAHPTEEQLRSEYLRSKGEFDVVDLSHIVVAYQGGQIPPRQGGQPAAREIALKIANELEGRLRSGEQFERVAAIFSDDQQSASAGGRLGRLQLAQLPPELRQPISEMKPGEISPPIISQFGIHIFRVNSRQPQSFNEVKPMLQQRARESVLRDAVDKLSKDAKVDYDSRFFPPAAKGKTPSS